MGTVLLEPARQHVLTSGLRTIIYPVKDLAQATRLHGELLGAEPVMDEAYDVQFGVGELEDGLDPNGHAKGMTGPLAYWHVDDIEKHVQRVVDAGAEVQEAVHDVGGGRLVASFKDADGNAVASSSHRDGAYPGVIAGDAGSDHARVRRRAGR